MLRPGQLTRAEGGYRLTGSWRYGSGIHAATWLLLSGHLPGADGERGRVLQCVIPTAEAAVPDDSWHVLGLRGTGSDSCSAVSAATVPLSGAATNENPAEGISAGRRGRTGW